MPASVEQALGAPHVEATPPLNRRPVCVGSLLVMAPVITTGPPTHAVAVAVPAAAVRVVVAVPATVVAVPVRVGVAVPGCVVEVGPTGVTVRVAVAGVPVVVAVTVPQTAAVKFSLNPVETAGPEPLQLYCVNVVVSFCTPTVSEAVSVIVPYCTEKLGVPCVNTISKFSAVPPEKRAARHSTTN